MLSALSDSQTTEVWDPLPALPIISHRNSTNEALWGTDAERAVWAKTTCHTHLIITHTVMSQRLSRRFVCVCFCACAREQLYLFLFLWILHTMCTTKSANSCVGKHYLVIHNVTMTHLIQSSFFPSALICHKLTFYSVCVNFCPHLKPVRGTVSGRVSGLLKAYGTQHIHYYWLSFLYISGEIPSASGM